MGLDVAARAHGEQKTKGLRAPYVVHVVKVATELLRVADGSFDVDFAMQCALLHDTMEDTGATHAELVAEFSARVADGVQALTKDAAVPRHERMADALRRIRLDDVESQGYCFQIDMLRRAYDAGLTVAEVPITFVERERGASNMTGGIVAEAMLRVTAWGITGLPRRFRRRTAAADLARSAQRA